MLAHSTNMIMTTDNQCLRASFRRVVVLNETTSNEATELFHALANSPASPEAQALDDLMDGDARSGA
jgi:hypothetical protein